MHVVAQALDSLTSAEHAALMARSETDIAGLLSYVAPLIERVRAEGDRAVRDLTRQFDKVDLGDRPLRASPDEFDAAEARLPTNVLEAIDVAVANIRKAHEDQLRDMEIRTEVAAGLIVGERTLPLDAAALYVPRGKGSFPSVVMMLTIPAVVAGVSRPVVVTPPGPDGSVDAATLVAARRAGVTEVNRVGGVHAIAALA